MLLERRGMVQAMTMTMQYRELLRSRHDHVDICVQAAAKAKGKKKASAMLSDDEETADDDSMSEGEWAPKVYCPHAHLGNSTSFFPAPPPY